MEILLSAFYINHIFQHLSPNSQASLRAYQATNLGQINIPLSDYQDFCQQAEGLEKDPTLVPRIAANTLPPGHGILGLLMQSCATLGEACQLGYQLQHLTRNNLHSELKFEPGIVISELDASIQEVNHAACLAEYCQASLLGMIDTLTHTDTKISPLQVSFSHSARFPINLYKKIYRTENIFFNQKESSIVFDRKILDIKIENSNLPAKLALLSEAKNQLSKLLKQRKISERLKELMLQDHTLDARNLTHYASQLKISESSLKHKLTAELTSYSQIQFEVRKKLARKYLLNTDLSIESIANLLGYKSRSTFARSFKDWYGMPPLQFKQNSSD